MWNRVGGDVEMISTKYCLCCWDLLFGASRAHLRLEITDD